MLRQKAHEAFKSLFFFFMVMRPERKEQFLAIFEIIDPKQILQAVRVKRIAFHIKEQITIIRHRHTSKAFARWEWDDLAFILTRGGFVVLQDSL